MARALEIALAEDGAVAEGRFRLAGGGGKRLFERFGLADDAHAAAAAPGRGFHQHREADLRLQPGSGPSVTAPARPPRVRSASPRACRRRAASASGGGPTQVRPAASDVCGESRALGEEAVAGVDGVGTGVACGAHERVGVEVRADQGDGSATRAWRAPSSSGGDGHDGVDAEPPAGADDPRRDLAAVRDEEAADPEGAVIRGAEVIPYVRYSLAAGWTSTSRNRSLLRPRHRSAVRAREGRAGGGGARPREAVPVRARGASSASSG